MVAIRRIERVLSIKDIKPNPSNARVHSNRQIGQIADSIKAFGFGAPVLVDETLTLIAGHGRLRAAELLGLKEIPAIELRGLSAARKRALALADNKIGDNAGWDREQLAIELPELSELLIEDGLDVGVTGFSAAELDQLDSSQPEFERLLSAFTQAAREHFDFEERQVWPRLRSALTDKAAGELGHRILQARQAVPAPPFPRESASSS